MNAHASAPAEAAHLQSNPMLGIGLKIASVSVFVCMSTLLKAAEGVPVGQLIFFRSFFAIFAILFILPGVASLAVCSTHSMVSAISGAVWSASAPCR